MFNASIFDAVVQAIGMGLGISAGLSHPKNSATRLPPGNTGDGTMDFSIATGDDTGFLALLEDI